jgi:hypothetical protein
MKTITTQLIKATTIVIFLSGQIAVAGSPMDAANDAILASMELARTRAREAVMMDFNFALTQVIQDTMSKQNTNDIRKTFIENQDSLRKEFEKIASIDVNKVTDLKTKLSEVYQAYTNSVRERFDMSYIVPITRESARNSLAMASRALSYFENNCQSGRGVGGIGVKAFDYPSLPAAQFQVNVNYGVSTDGKNGSGGGGITSTGTGSDAEKQRNQAVMVATTAASITTSIAISGTAFGAGSSAATVAACQAAAPFMWAGVGVVALAAMYMSHTERIKAENEIVEAKIHAFHGMADDRHVADLYKQECVEVSQQVKKIRTILDTAYHDPEKLANQAEQVPDLDKEIEKYNAILIDRQKLIEEFNQLHEIIKTGAADAVDEATKKRDALVELIRKKDDELKNASTPERVGQIMLAHLVNKDSELHNQLGDLNFQAIDLAQRKAFESLMNLISLVQKENFNKFLGNNGLISQELKHLDKFLRAKKLFQDTLTLQIKLIFNRVSIEDVRQSEKLLRAQTLALVKSHGLNQDVVSFARQVKSLIGGL